MNIDDLIRLIPSSEKNLKRLDYLYKNAELPRIAVFGIYNHGKSTLLNALIGKEIFKAADKRETKEIKEYQNNGLIWVDTPGLSADIGKKDDEVAKDAFKIADFIFIVHNVQVGELDKVENSLYNRLMRQDKNYKKKLFLLLTQIDQVDKNDLEKIKNEIRAQISNIEMLPVSAVRFLKGKKEGKPKFIELSGIPETLEFIENRKTDVKALRKKEISRLVAKAIVELNVLNADSKKRLDKYEHDKNMKIRSFENDFRQTIHLIKTKMGDY